jgi:hypothetical protein
MPAYLTKQVRYLYLVLQVSIAYSAFKELLSRLAQCTESQIILQNMLLNTVFIWTLQILIYCNTMLAGFQNMTNDFIAYSLYFSTNLDKNLFNNY